MSEQQIIEIATYVKEIGDLKAERDAMRAALKEMVDAMKNTKRALDMYPEFNTTKMSRLIVRAQDILARSEAALKGGGR